MDGEAEEYRGFHFQILPDDNAESPRAWDNRWGTIYAWHRRHEIGDVHYRGRDSDPTPEEVIAELGPGAVIVPLYLLDHSGIMLSTSDFRDPWDSGQVGFIAMTAAEIRTEYGVKRISGQLRKRVADTLTADIAVYNQYLTGDVWGYVVQETEDSCWGFFGYDEAVSEAKELIDADADERDGREAALDFSLSRLLVS